MKQEVWKPIFNGEYAVSSFGRVKRLLGGKWKKAGRILNVHLEKPKRNKNHYAKITLWHNGKVYTSWVHKLVCLAFYGPRPNGCWVNHIDGNKSNNHLENLEYVTYSENIRHSYRNGLSPTKLSQLAVGRMKHLYSLGVTPRELSRIFSIHEDYASRVVRNKNTRLSFQPCNPRARYLLSRVQ